MQNAQSLGCDRTRYAFWNLSYFDRVVDIVNQNANNFHRMIKSSRSQNFQHFSRC